jgi:hypothetical protein
MADVAMNLEDLGHFRPGGIAEHNQQHLWHFLWNIKKGKIWETVWKMSDLAMSTSITSLNGGLTMFKQQKWWSNGDTKSGYHQHNYSTGDMEILQPSHCAIRLPLPCLKVKSSNIT